MTVRCSSGAAIELRVLDTRMHRASVSLSSLRFSRIFMTISLGKREGGILLKEGREGELAMFDFKGRVTFLFLVVYV
jgi:hypothetical protein